jgi:hypothetical protein
MDYPQAERELLRFQAQYQRGQMRAELYEEITNTLRVQDHEGYTWQQGINSGFWYRYSNGKWLVENPPLGQQPVRWAGSPIPSQPDIQIPSVPVRDGMLIQTPTIPPETLTILPFQETKDGMSRPGPYIHRSERGIPLWIFVSIVLLLAAIIISLIFMR